MFFGATVPVAEMHQAVANHEHKRRLADIEHGKLVRTWLGMLPKIVNIIWKTRRMIKKLDCLRLNDFLEMTINEIRAEHKIRI